MGLRQLPPVYVLDDDPGRGRNEALAAEFERHRDDRDMCRSHFFGGRFENLYLPLERVPALGPVLERATAQAGEILGLSPQALQIGFWFNAMDPGHRTLPHTHDDSDELLSGVYYVRVPPDSGDLIISAYPFEVRIEAVEGRYVFFPPDLEHAVTENRSTGQRLSIGMNFGRKRSPGA